MHRDMDVTGEETEERTDDTLLDGRVRLRQSRSGYRAGLDAALLAAACDAAPGECVIEAGCGAGAVLLAAAARRPGVRCVGIERDVVALELAQTNIAANHLQERVSALEGDIGAPFSQFGMAHFDAALANPPFFDDAAAIREPRPAKRSAWIADDGLAAWITFLVGSVRQGGTITLIHRADRLADILGLLAAKCGSVQIRPVQPFSDVPAKRVLVRAFKSGKAPLRLLPPLILHARGAGKHTAHVETILRGDGALSWP